MGLAFRYRGYGGVAVSSAVRSVSGASQGTTGRCRGVMFTDVEHGHAGSRRLDLSTANGTWGFTISLPRPPAQIVIVVKHDVGGGSDPESVRADTQMAYRSA